MGEGEKLFVRHEARSPEGQKALEAYSQAVGVMKGRAPDNETSWAYQAAIHGTPVKPKKKLWEQCEHGSWFFFPWHRIFLYYFERIVRQAVIDAGGQDQWALPYWNYGLEGDHGALPDPFIEPADEAENPLYVATRSPVRNAGWPIEGLGTREREALQLRQFEGNAMFGGLRGPAKAGFWRHPGLPEETPHGEVHVEVGGWMLLPATAAQDPIFWLHHANVDRIWAVWNEREGGENPSDPLWQNQTFTFYDADRTQAEKSCQQASDTRLLGYTYDPRPTERT
jgi:Common central domain of tyrosinase/Polyphenol oxidase middle domain